MGCLKYYYVKRIASYVADGEKGRVEKLNVKKIVMLYWCVSKENDD